MQKKSSNSVKVKYLDKDKIILQLRNACKKIKQDNNVQKIFLFGSFVRGDFLPSSDADICIILKKNNQRIIDRIPQFLDFFIDINVPVDIFPYTLYEVEKMKNMNNSFIKEVLETGVEL